jgi:hypothetical protein
MAENINRVVGQGNAYKLDKGGTVVQSGPFVGKVKNNIDPTRSGRIQVYLDIYGGDESDSATWRTVNYLSPFMGVTNQNNQNFGTDETGDFFNKQSYGMWWSAPDVGTNVLCFFANGDPNQGYYLGSVMEPGIGHMLPAIGATNNYVKTSKWGSDYVRLPVTEINVNSEDISEDSQFYNRSKPIHEALAGQMLFQGLLKDPIRGPIGSSSHRESPSKVFGFSTPGPAIHADATKINTLTRLGGHSFVMDDGDEQGNDKLVRIRTSAGHQITLSDSGESIYITHANGHAWVELGKEGTLDVFSTNSVNVRTKGDINLHADNNINMYAGNQLNAFSKNTMKLESTLTSIRSEAELKLYSKLKLVARSDNILALDAEQLGSFDGGDSLVFSADCISLNSGAGVPVSAATAIRKNKVADTKFSTEWTSEGGQLETINTRVPTHEPWPYHNRGTQNSVDYTGTLNTAFPEYTTEALQSAAAFAPDGISVDDYTKVDRATIEIGTLNTDQLTGLKAQIAKETGLDYADFDADIGVGKFGLSPEQLERAGYLTPGTVANYLKDPLSTVTGTDGITRTNTERLLSNTNFWTEKDGVSNLTSFLNSKSAQESAVESTMQDSFSTLRSNGVVKGTEASGDLGGLLTGAVRYGVNDTVKWAKGQDLNSTTKSGISQSVRDGQFAVAYVDEKITTTVSAYSSPGGYSNTINDQGVTDTVNSIIDNPKITGA